MTALRELTWAEDIVILPADNGGTTVILSTDDYRRKLQDLLDLDYYMSSNRHDGSRSKKKECSNKSDPADIYGQEISPLKETFNHYCYIVKTSTNNGL